MPPTGESSRGSGGPPPAGLRILGVDPGTRLLGHGVIELVEGLRPRVIAHGVCRLDPGNSLAERLGAILDHLGSLIDRTRPAVVAVESAFHGKNIQSALRIGEARGVVLACAASRGLGVEEYAPATIKKTICGNGRAPKSQVQAMVERLLELEQPIEQSDEADALAIAYCHFQKLRTGSILPAGVARKPARGPRRLSRRGLQDLVDRINKNRG